MMHIVLLLLAIPIGLFAGMPHQNSPELQNAALQSLNLETYTTWTPEGTIPQVFSVTIDKHMAAMRADQSGRTWLIQNEPERLSSDNGSETPATVVAVALQDVEQSFACCGIMVNQIGLQWMDEYLAAGGPIPDAWHIHIYQGWTGGWTYAANQFRHWMIENGVERPVIVSETSAAYLPVATQKEILQTAFDFMQSNEWLTTVIWFSVHHSSVESTWTQAQLVDSAGQPTRLGEMFIRLRAQQNGEPEPTSTATSPSPAAQETLTPQATPEPTATTEPAPTETSPPATTPTTTNTPVPAPSATSDATDSPAPAATPNPVATNEPEPPASATIPPLPISDNPLGGRPDAIPHAPNQLKTNKMFLPAIFS